MNNITIKIILGTAAVASLISGCVKADYTSVSDHPRKSQITVKTDWSKIGNNVPIPKAVNILQNEDIIIPTSDGTLPLVDPGDYRLVIYNEAYPTVINSQKFDTMDTREEILATLTRDQYNFIEDKPEWLFSSYKDVTLERDKKYTEIFIMQQQIRELNFDMTITEGNPNLITDITAELSGVAAGWKLVKNEPYGTAAKVKPVFTRTNDKLKAKVYLLGIQDEPQVLIIRFTFDEKRTQEILSNVTLQLKNFNEDKVHPMTLKGELHSPISAEQAGKINNWIVLTDNINVN